MSKGTKTVVAKPAAKKAVVSKTAEKKAPAKAAKPATEKKAAAKAEEKKVVAEAAPAKKPAAKPATEKKAAAVKKVTVNLEADCPLATTVSVAGSFNNWMVDVDMLKKDKKSGLWKIKLELLPGEYEYKFVCDGQYWDEGANKVVKA